MTLIDTLKLHSFTASLSEAQLALLASIAEEVEFPENEVIIEAGEQSRRFFLLVEGSVSVEFSGRAFHIQIEALERGTAFGWSALLDRHDTLFLVRAREHTKALAFDAGALSKTFQTDPALAAVLLRGALSLAAERLQATETKFAELCGVREVKKRRAASPVLH